MYETYYGLREKPFSILPDPDLIYRANTHRLAFAMLEFGVMNNAGFTVITAKLAAVKPHWCGISCDNSINHYGRPDFQHAVRQIRTAAMGYDLVEASP